MKTSELITILQSIKDEYGDISVCVSEKHEYWGSVENYLSKYDVTVSTAVQPKGPKSGEFETAVVISCP